MQALELYAYIIMVHLNTATVDSNLGVEILTKMQESINV